MAALDDVKAQIKTLSPEQIKEHLRKIHADKEKARARLNNPEAKAKAKVREKERREKKKLFIKELIAAAEAKGISLDPVAKAKGNSK